MLPNKNIDKGLLSPFFGSLIYKEKRIIYKKENKNGFQISKSSQRIEIHDYYIFFFFKLKLENKYLYRLRKEK